MTMLNNSDDTGVLVPTAPAPRALTTLDFHQLAAVPPATAWFADLDNPQTRRVYENDVREFMAFAGIADPRSARSAAATYWPGAMTSSSARWAARRSVASSRRCRLGSMHCAKPTRSRATRSTA
jgi:hypothetical protein